MTQKSKSHLAGEQEELFENEEDRETNELIKLKFSQFESDFEKNKLQKTDLDMETYIEKHSKVKKKK